MGYEGARVADFVADCRDAVDPAGRTMAKDGGAFMRRMVVQNTPVDTGELRESIQEKSIISLVGAVGQGWEGGCYTEVVYALHVEHGTGLWGPQHAKYRIEPKDPDGVLAFYVRVKTPEGKPSLNANYSPVEGNLVFARYVMHPGSPGQHMFAIAATMAESAFEQICEPGLREWQARSYANW